VCDETWRRVLARAHVIAEGLDIPSDQPLGGVPRDSPL
jgi:hypothetical protein